MAVINAIAGKSGRGGYANSCVSADLSSYDFIGWPPAQADVDAAPAVAITRVVARAHPQIINVSAGHSYADDFYDRIHIAPSVIDLGNLLATQMRTVNVWNAWRGKAMTLTELNEVSADGLTATGEGPLPLSFNPLQARAWSITISTDGPSIIDAALTWVFDDGTRARVSIIGNRLTAWFVLPNWATGVTETLSWLTEVQTAHDGTEWRSPQRSAPRRSWEFSITLNARDRQNAESALFAWRARVWSLPVWVDQSHLAAPLAAGATTIALATAGLDFAAGETALLRTADLAYELVEVSAVAAATLTLARPTLNAWPAGAAVYPCRTARLTDAATLGRKSSDVVECQVKFQAVGDCEWPTAAPVSMFKGYPVLEDRIEESTDPTAKYDRVLDTLDNDIGTLDVTDRTGKAVITQSHAWTRYGRDDRAAHRSLLYWLQGRANALWLPSWADDLTLASQVASNALVLRTVACGMSLYLQGNAGRRALRLELHDATVLYRSVMAATDLGDGTEQLQIDASLGRLVNPADVRQISWMMLGRLASDSVELAHDADSMGIARCNVSFTGVPAEEPA